MRRVYCVINLETGKQAYLGLSILRTAMALEPGYIYGWGPNAIVAISDVQRRARAFRS